MRTGTTCGGRAWPRPAARAEVPGGRRYAPHPLLSVITDDSSEDARWPVSGVMWSYADRFFDGAQRRDIGYTALSRGAYQDAARLLGHDDAAIDPAAYNQVSVLFYQHSEWAASRDWWQKAIATGHPDEIPAAMFDLGVLEREQGNPNHARHWLEQAAATAHPGRAPAAMFNLGVLGKEQGNPDLARHWYEQAVATGHPDDAPTAIVNLGALEEEQRNSAGARHWWEQAVPLCAAWLRSIHYQNCSRNPLSTYGTAAEALLCLECFR